MGRSRCAAAGLAGLVVVLAGWPPPAAAGGGDWLLPVRDRYEPGETAVMVGYTGAVADALPGGVDDGPYYGHLRADPAASGPDGPGTWPYVHPTDVPLGPTTVTETGRHDQFAVRLSITFAVPADLAPGRYEVFVCDDPCTTSLGLLTGGTLNVGVEPLEPIDRQWLIDDPAVGQLDGGDLVAGIPVARIRAGHVGTPWYDARAADPPPTAPPATTGPTTSATEAPTADREDEAGPTEIGLGDAAPWLAGVAAVAGIWWLRPRRRGPAPDAPTADPPEPPAPDDADDALTAARS